MSALKSLHAAKTEKRTYILLLSAHTHTQKNPHCVSAETLSCEGGEFKLRVNYHVLSPPGPLGEWVLMLLLQSYFEVLAVFTPHSAVGCRIESCLSSSFPLREVYPFMAVLEDQAIVGVRGCEHSRGAELWVVLGSLDEEPEQWRSTPTTTGPRSLRYCPFIGKYDKSRKCLHCGVW